jgi:uncharacterized YigZ family protein
MADQHPDAYNTLLSESTGEYKDKGSKFYAFANGISSEEEFDGYLKTVKSLHPKARHFCYAYRLLQDDIFRINDDGEPSGTAGKPIFNQIMRYNLYDTACIVVRYFGGTKLGVSGLIKAYKEACKHAFESAEIIEKFLCTPLTLKFDYSLMGTLIDTLKSLDIEMLEKTFGESPNLTLAIKNSEIQWTIDRIKAAMLKRPVVDIETDTEVEGLTFLLH